VLHSVAVRCKRQSPIEQCGILNRFICIVLVTVPRFQSAKQQLRAVLAGTGGGADSSLSGPFPHYVALRAAGSECRSSHALANTAPNAVIGNQDEYGSCAGCKHALSLTARIGFRHFEDVF
jgi:hypothetical protein